MKSFASDWRVGFSTLYGTTSTAHGARLTSFCETLPSTRPAIRPRPRLPTTTTSRFNQRAVSRIVCAASPTHCWVSTERTPSRRARFFASCNYSVGDKVQSLTEPPSASANLAISILKSIRSVSVTVTTTSLAAFALANVAAMSTARPLPSEPSVAAMTSCMKRRLVRSGC